MKKVLTLIAILALSTSFSYGANSLKQQIKNDFKQTKSDVKSAIKADVENNRKANQQANNAKKQQKISEIDAKIKDLNSQIASVKKDKTITETERTLKLNRLQSQVNYYNKQKAALQ